MMEVVSGSNQPQWKRLQLKHMPVPVYSQFHVYICARYECNKLFLAFNIICRGRLKVKYNCATFEAVVFLSIFYKKMFAESIRDWKETAVVIKVP